VTGLDVAPDALAVAQAHDASRSVRYVEGDALALSFEDGSFDAVCAMSLPEHIHVLHLFLKPEEVRAACTEHGLEEPDLIGIRPKLTLPFWRMLVTGRVAHDFTFTFTRSTRVAYTGAADKRG